MHIDVACISHELISLFSKEWPIFYFFFSWRSASIHTSAEIWYQELSNKTFSHDSHREACQNELVVRRAAGGDTPWLRIKLTVHVKPGLHWNAWPWWTLPWHKEILFLFLMFPLAKGFFYTNTAKQIGLILRSISSNPEIQFSVRSTRKGRNYENNSLCVASELLQTHSSLQKSENRARASETVAVGEQWWEKEKKLNWAEREENSNTSERNCTLNGILLKKKYLHTQFT